MTQEKISDPEIQHISLYTTKVHEKEPRHQVLTINDDQLQVFELFQNISTTVGKEYDFDKLKPSTNIKNFIIDLMDSVPNEDYKIVKLLLNDFKDNLKTQQRMHNRYVLLALFKDNLELIHSRKELGIGQIDENEESPLQVIKRYFDSGNVDRWVRVFKDTNDVLKVRLYERYKSPVLHNFLGVPSGERFYEFGDIQLIVKLMDNEMSMDLSIEEAIDKIINSDYITFHRNYVLISDTRFKLSKILCGNEKIDSPTKLKQLLLSEKFSLYKVTDEYKKLPSNINYYCDYKKFVQEDHHSVDSINVENGVIECELLFEKPDNNIEIICTNDNIWPTQEYLESIAEKVYSGKGLTIFHPGHKLTHIPLDFGNIKILNECNLADDVFHIVDQLFKHASQYDTGNILKHIFLSHAITTLSNSIDEPLKTFFSALSNSLCGHCYVDRKEMITKNESPFIEYKSGKKITGNVEKDIKTINDDVLTKGANSKSRLIIYGIDEDSMKFDELHINILKSDNIGQIEEEVRNNIGMLIKASPLIISEKQKVLAISVFNPDYSEEIGLDLLMKNNTN